MSEQFKAGESGLLVVFMHPGDESLPTFHDWYDTEHVPLRIERFPTFRSAVRYAVTSTTLSHSSLPETTWGALYTISDNSVFAHTSYTSLRTQRSPREAELFTRLGVVDRRIYRLEYDSDTDPSLSPPSPLGLEPQLAKDTPSYLVCNSVDIAPEAESEFNAWWEQEHVPMLAKVPGWRRSRRFTLIDNGLTGTHAKPGDADQVPKNLGLHEWHSPPENHPAYKASLTTQWRAKVTGEDERNVLRRERKTCTVYRAWDPTAALSHA
ncbi:uncharacterized protein PAN0_007d3108 [Moesziomyces antarcticus]|uniref:Uncharacterized protein n=2 Tax=Pseudozyma antarctica TaxID=84753 RepID=A0A5C3FNW8_PSEA2|nr:uncharacterized protein PAN0_007d3108 [Moesziomyces antarcticus]GAK64892.1 conserved hypothetical protein [Moesziomyces antarcticus]SPO46123.1 uncharacterized protein PSANT_03809 [Moesziomyces antarcticus]